jgi:serine/threonine protein kinase
MDKENLTQPRSSDEETHLASPRDPAQTEKRAAAPTISRESSVSETIPQAAQEKNNTFDNPVIKPSQAATRIADHNGENTRPHTQKRLPDTELNTSIQKLVPRTHEEIQRLVANYPGKQILKERFVLMSILGSGGMGNVYLAKDLLREEMEDSDSLIAIKVLNENCRRLPGALQSLQREAKKAQTLSHPNIVTVYDFDRDGETAFITMEYIDGESLKDYLRKNKRMPHEKAMYVIERVARGLAYAHQQGYAHADIKPANIFLGQNGAVKILDFGIARAFTEAAKEKRSLADDLTEGALTPGYASMDMLQGKTPLPVDDVYSLACMAYELMRGRHPFIGDDGLPMPADIAKEKGAKLQTIAGIPRRHMNALKRGLAFEREQRFPDAGRFIEAIKKRNLKKDLGLLLLAACVTGVGIWLANTALEQVVPSVDSLKPELYQVAVSIREADDLLVGAEIDTAHRLYSQAWELANDLTTNDIPERKKARAILADRMTQVSKALAEQAQNPELDEYQLRELLVALDFMAQDDIIKNKKHIEKAIRDINKQLQGKSIK